MKKIYLLAIAVITAAGAIKAQTPCTSGRYAADTFTSITTNSGIAYGSNTTISGSTQILTMDVSQPMLALMELQVAHTCSIQVARNKFRSKGRGRESYIHPCQSC